MYELFAGIIVVILFGIADSQDNDHASDVSANLYLKLRSIAFPMSPYSAAGITNNRLVLMSPGKVLNYYDYYPGDEYTASVQMRNMSDPESLVPPSVMEKWFDISDVVVSGDTFGGTTGKQLSVIYETILSQMTIKNFKKLYVDGEAKFNEASTYLTEPVQNPVNLTDTTTRMFLYSFYHEEYAQRRLEMEEIINDARKKYGSLEYELWFQRNYQLLNAKVESAYTKWLVFGEKELVEAYKSILDTSAASAQLQKARNALRSSGVTSLDRTRTIYPVSFEPSNWYEYLLPKKTPPSRDMLITKRSMLQSQRDVLIAMNSYMSTSSNNSKRTVDALKSKVSYTTGRRNNATKEAVKAYNDCVSKNAEDSIQSSKGEKSTNKNPCNKLKQAVKDLADTTSEEAQASSEVFSSSFLLSSDSQYQYFLRSRIKSLNRSIEAINDQLTSSQSVYLGGIFDSKEFVNLQKETSEELNNKWMQFEYDERSSYNQTNENKVAKNIDVSVRILLTTGDSQYNKETYDFQQALKNTSMKVSGEVLRVTIKRPWFRPSLFENPSLSFVQFDDNTDKVTLVSPPPSSEDDLRKYINGEMDYHYLLPEYVTSFLLTRNVKLQYSDMKSSTVSHVMQELSTTSVSSFLLVFSLSASVQVGQEEQSLRAERTANGMIINIPGVQLIGYYTQAMPEFPRS